MSSESTERLLILKECSPHDERFIRQKDFVVRPKKKNDTDAEKYLNALKENMAQESKIGQKVSAITRRVIGSWENFKVSKFIIDEKTFDAGDSFFILMEKASQGVSLQEFLQNTGKPAPYITVCIMEQLLNSLNYIHSSGYIHGDIQENNFLLLEINPALGDVGYGLLLDLGNARKILDDGATAVIDDEIFTTPGYCSPEIWTSEKNTLRLTQATDIYSAGALMLYLIKGFDFKTALGKDMAPKVYKSSPVTEYEAVRRGYRCRAATFVGEILFKALKQNPKERYQNASEMLEDIRKLKQMVEPPKFKLSPNLSISPDYIEGSRYNEIVRLQNDLKSKNPIFIWGIWGIGKSTLAVAFAKKQIENGMDAYFVSYKGSIKETVLNMNFSGYEFSENDTEKDYIQRLNILRENYAGSLLIIDNFDRLNTDIAELQQEVAYKEIIALDMHIIFTTRSRPDKVTPELKPLSEQNALKLFKTITKDTQADQKPEVLELLREVNYHSLTVSLLAHTISESWNNITAEFLLSKFKSGNFNDADKVYQQIKILLNLFDLEEYRYLLCHTTLLPLDGFDARIFIDSESNAKKNC